MGDIGKSILSKTLVPLFRFTFLENVGNSIKKLPVAIAIIFLGLSFSIYSLYHFKDIELESNAMELEEEGIMSAVYQDKILDKFKMSPDVIMLVANNINDCRTKVKQLKKIADRTDLLGRIDALSEFYPDETVQKENSIAISQYNEKLNSLQTNSLVTKNDIQDIKRELKRLHNNIVEIGELSISTKGEQNNLLRKCDEITGTTDSASTILELAAFFNEENSFLGKLSAGQKISSVEMKKCLLEKCSGTPVSLENIPTNISDRYIGNNNNRLLIQVFSKEQIYDTHVLKRFEKQVKKVDKAATGTPIHIHLFNRLVVEKGRIASLIAIAIIIILLFIDFRSILFTFFAMIPLLMGSSWMLGMMYLLGIKFNIANFVVLPIILGIGIDDGVHILHRYKIEGKGSIPHVLRYTGRAVLLTSLTTIIAFGVMAFSYRRGPASAGLVLAFGVAFCFITSVIVLPALISVYEKISSKTAN